MISLLIGTVVAFVVAVLGTPLVIRILRAASDQARETGTKGAGQPTVI